MAFRFNESELQQINTLLARYPSKMSATLPLLHMVQRREGWVSPDAIEEVARLLELTRIHVADVVSFYTMYHRKPIGKHLVSVCRTLCCQLVGQEDLSAYLRQRFSLTDDHVATDSSGTFTVEHVECLGACGAGPVVIIDGQYHERVTVQRLGELLDGLQAAAGHSREAQGNG